MVALQSEYAAAAASYEGSKVEQFELACINTSCVGVSAANSFLQLEAPEKHHSLHPFRDEDTIASCSHSIEVKPCYLKYCGDLALLFGVSVLWS